MRYWERPYLDGYRHPARALVLLVTVLHATGILVGGSVWSTVAFMLALFGLPVRGWKLRMAGALLLVLLTQNWPYKTDVFTDTPERDALNLVFDRTVTAGALLAEAVQVAFRLLSERRTTR
ncbi:hypothetical protein CLV92_10423 [Kineococcus xinjiangensis]|uniref:Uncharacterized protein n=1 Tax=Kineococcus xinjiangensis TaxID=512762 RepID=A0A2S6ISK3_9ACTN|nr:hypothetical protein [Kineococcus xinjiangensis]PPK97208.1 hypothetical protein CLV92_10423 [Kineococcus xinjiangensis]